MKKFIPLLSLIFILSCESDGSNQRCDIINPVTINLANPEFINIQVPGGWSYANGGPKGLVIYNFGSNYKAFSRECPSITNCGQKMNVVNDIKLVCPCDDAEFSILDGSPQTAGINESVCEFRVERAGSGVLNISNF